jgi:hypothetical protein
MTDNAQREKVDEEVSGSELAEETEQSPGALANDGDSTPQEVTDDGDSGQITVESVAEAVLFASDEPLSVERLAGIVGTGSVRDIRKV